MGDLKKKKIDYYARTEDGEEIRLNEDEIYADDDAIDLLRGYIKNFAKQQMDKQKEESDGTV